MERQDSFIEIETVSRIIFRSTIASIAITLSLSTVPALADDYFWGGTAGNHYQWQTGPNDAWVDPPGIPGAGDTAIFESGAGHVYNVAAQAGGRIIFRDNYSGIGFSTVGQLPSGANTGEFTIQGIGGIGIDNRVDQTIHVKGHMVIGDDQQWRITNNVATAGLVVSDGQTPTLDLGANTLTLNPVNAVNFVDMDVEVSGTGGLSTTGLGTVTLSRVNPYTGPTNISSGTLALTGTGSIAQSSVVHADGSFSIADTTAGASIQSLSGSGLVELGAQRLTLTNAAHTFSGVIQGTGGLTVGSGTEILSGANTYTGGTTITGGSTLQIGSGGATGSIRGDVRNNGSLIFNRIGTLMMGGAITGAGDVSQIGTGTTVLTGDSSYTGGTTIADGTLQLGDGGTSGSIVGDVTNDGILAFNRSDEITFDGQITGTGGVRQIGPGRTDLTADSSGLTGLSRVQAGTLAVNGTLGGTMEVRGGRLEGTGQVGGTTNFTGGVIAPGNSIGTLLIAGDYAGSGGTLEIEGVFSGTGSPADRLVITGNATGTTTIHTINLGGNGAATGTGNTDGISIVQVGGDSTADTFELQGGYAAAGPYQYHLNAFDPGSSAAGEVDPLLGAPPFWDYRLQRALDENGNPIPVPQVPGYQALPSGALNYGASLFDSLHKRLGEIRHLADTHWQGEARSQDTELFLRAKGMRGDFDGDAGPDYDQTTWFTQAGGNAIGWDGNGYSWRGGFAVSYGGSQIDIDSTSAEVDLRGPSLALISTYQAASGWYLDAITQATRYSAEITTSERGETGDPKGWGTGLSLESGYPFELGDRLILEPQVQIAYQRVWFDEFIDVDRIHIDLQSGDSLRGRAGARLQKTFVSQDGDEQALWSPYAEVNVVNEFLDDDSIAAAGVGFGSDAGGTSIQFGGGVNAQLGPNTALFVNLSYAQALTNGAGDTWGGTGGVRVNF